MEPKRVVLGVSGGVAAYRALDVARILRRSNVEVHTVMTDAAQRFVSPLSFRTITGNPTHADMFAEPLQWRVTHVGLAECGDLILVCPATANLIGKVASGIADNLLSAVIMATRLPVAFVPAMNEGMWRNPIVRSNVGRLRALGYHFLEPGHGHLACGHVGQGRLPEPDVIAGFALGLLEKGEGLSGVRVLVTAGPTRESIDAIRFLSNRSSGKMGYALAEVARQRGAEVLLVTGPTDLAPPAGVQMVKVESARDMYEAVRREFHGVQVVIKAAAVADYTPSRVIEGKMKKAEGPFSLALDRTTDILAELGREKGSRILVGFAAESDDLLDNAARKMVEKKLNFIVANPAAGPDSAFGSDTNRAVILWPGGEREDLGVLSKRLLAGVILDRVEQLIKSPD